MLKPFIFAALIIVYHPRRVASFFSPRTSVGTYHHAMRDSCRRQQQKCSLRFMSNGPSDQSTGTISPIQAIQNSFGFQKDQFNKAQSDGFGTRARNAAINATVGEILVPLCSNLDMRQRLANRGIYAGVEYEICMLELQKEGEEESVKVQSLQGLDLKSREGVVAVAMIKPAYPLREHLERDDWPVEIKLEDVPLWLSKATYEAGTVVGTLALSSSFLFFAAIIAFFVRVVTVPTPSMVPALNPGSIILVTRTIPIGPLKPNVGDVVFFDAPSELDAAISKFAAEQAYTDTASTKGKQFLKRVVAVPGESVGVKQSSPYVQLSDTKYRFDVIGPYARPEVFPDSSWDRPIALLGKNEYFVAGDNGYRSVDSRVWGPLKQKYIVGTAKWVLWPLNDFGPVKAGQISEVTKPKS
jgi:signal peptidase I